MSRRRAFTPSHVYEKDGIMYFRVAFTSALRAKLKRTEFRMRLPARSRRAAHLLAAQLYAHFQKLMKMAGDGMVNYLEIKQRMASLLWLLIEDYEHAEARDFKGEGDEVFHPSSIDVMIEYSKRFIDEGRQTEGHGQFVTLFLVNSGLFSKEDMNGTTNAIIAKEYAKTQLLAYTIMKKRREGDFEFEIPYILNGEQSVKRVRDTDTTEHSHVGRVIVQQSKTSKENFSTTDKSFDYRLQNCIEKYLATKVYDKKIKESSIDTHRSRLTPLVLFFGNINITEITRDDMRRYRDTIKKIPPYSSRRKEFAGMSMAEIASLKHEKTLDTATISQFMDTASTLFQYIARETNAPVHDISGLSLPNDTPDTEKRDSFTENDLRIIFSYDNFCNTDFTNPAYYWVPLICLFSGMRSEEASQLYVNDIKYDTASSMHYFDITLIDTSIPSNSNIKSTDKTLKNKSATRTIPVHKILIDAGLIDYVSFIKRRKHKRLFPMLNKSPKSKFNKQVGKQFSTIVRGLKIEGKKTMHSLRHTFDNFYKQNLIHKESLERDIFRYTFGHRVPSLDFSVYGNAPRIQVLYDVVISRLDYGVDFSHLAGSKYVNFLGTNTPGRRWTGPAARDKTKKG